MKSYSWILILVLFLSGFSSCHSDAERYKDILREGSWYVYDIDYSYKLYDDFETPELFDFFHYLLDERNLLFLPGDELMFSKRRIDVNCPDGDRFGYDYYYSGDYIRIGRDGDYMDLFPQGDMNALTLTLDRIGLENLLSYWAPVDEYYAYLLEAAYRNLYDFNITYHLQRPIPEMAQVMPGIYIGPMYDGNQQLMNEAATVNLFWEKGQMNMTLDDKVILEDENGPGPQFYVDIAGLQVDKGRTPGSYVFTGEQSFTDRQYGPVEVRIREGRYNAAGTVAVWLEIVWNENVYELDFQKGVRQWDFQSLKVKSSEKTIILKK